MKILLLNQTFYPDTLATSQQLTDLAIYLVSQGHEVTVFSGRRSYENRDKIFSKEETYNGVKVYRISSTGFGKQRFILRILDAVTFDFMLFLKLLVFPKQDVVISFTSPPLLGLFGSLFCSFKGGRAVQWLMDINPGAVFAVGYIKRKSFLGRVLNWIFEFSLRASSHIVVLDRWMKKVIIQHGAAEDSISIIHPWSLFEPAKELSDPRKSTFRQVNKLGDKTVIMYSGNHSVVHPLYTLMEAAKRLKDDPTVVFAFVGGGLRSLEVKEFKEKEQLDNIVQLPLVPREQLSDALTSVDAHVVVMGEAVNGLVHTSKVYGALATGRPIIYISPGQSHLADLLESCQQTYHAEHGDVEKVIQAIRQIKGLTKENKEKAATLNKAFYLEQFSKSRCFETFSEQVLKIPQTKRFIASEKQADAYSPRN